MNAMSKPVGYGGDNAGVASHRLHAECDEYMRRLRKVLDKLDDETLDDAPPSVWDRTLAVHGILRDAAEQSEYVA